MDLTNNTESIETIVQYLILGLIVLATLLMLYGGLKPFFKKKERFTDSSGSSRIQNDLIGRKQK